MDQNELQSFTRNIEGLVSNLNLQNIPAILKFVGDLPGMGEFMGNGNGGDLTSIIGNLVGGNSGGNNGLLDTVRNLTQNGNTNPEEIFAALQQNLPPRH
jgi:protein gp37